MIKKLVSLLVAVFSGKCSKEDYLLRNLSCNTCVEIIKEGDKRYCGACGCPKNKWTNLDKKLHYKKLVCPLNRPGFYEGRYASHKKESSGE